MKAIKTKIGSVKNIRQITKALEIVSTVKLKKVKNATDNYRAFLGNLLETIYSIDEKVDIFNMSEYKAQTDKTLVIAISSEKGLCGSLNSKLFKRINEQYKNQIDNVDMFCLGKKAKETFKREGYNIIGETHIKDSFQENDLIPISEIIKQALKKQQYKAVVIAYNHFKNAMTQLPIIFNVFPFNKESFENFMNEIEATIPENQDHTKEIACEPSTHELKNNLQTMIIQHIVYGAILQNKAGEFASRMIAMKNATDNSTNLIKSLTLTFNKARQAAITQEVSEIVSAKVSME